MKINIKPIIEGPEYRSALGLPDELSEEYRMLAQGEYNINYCFTHPVTKRRLVLRINAGSQMHLDRQIEYEAHALRLLAGTKRTPRVYYVDGSLRCSDHGFMVMEYLPGGYPHYDNRAEMNGVMACLADIHSIEIPAEEIIYGEPEAVPRDTIKLIAPADPAEAILAECENMVKTYMESPLGDETVKMRLRALLDRAHEIAAGSQSAGQSAGKNTGQDSFEASGEKGEAYRCCINTELNSTNFLVDGDRVRLVDWEKPLYGDPAQDLGHLLAPTTTFWKTDHILSQKETDRLIDEYIKAVRGRFDTSGIRERTHRLISITCLRGLTWCAMAWVQYQDPDKLIANESTRLKLDAYLSDSFLSDIEKRLGLQKL
ncbi:MAG: aminoglycoside phosphotransferase family protein [Mogibacterium sp.]|nr:aminoglycoside phosphotransferase family protein [Mogibacterium sp.]